MEQESFKFDIAVLLPTRGRTTALTRSVMTLINRVRNLDKMQILLGFDDDDTVGLAHFQKELEPILKDRKVHYKALSFAPVGYIRLNEYVTALARAADKPRWFMFWNDDAVMESQNWDEEICKYNNQFKVLAVHTHREHPYSIFPIVPSKWLEIFGYMSPHQLSDAWFSQVAYMLDIWERIPVWVEHDRFDLTGNNNDETYANRPQLENQPNNPEDFHSSKWHYKRIYDANTLANYLRANGADMTWWDNVQTGKQNPWQKLEANDINKQMTQSRTSMTYGQ
jgi:hypothetical protein